MTHRTATARPVCRLLALAAVAALSLPAGSHAAAASAPDEVRCLEAEVTPVVLPQPDLDVGELRLRGSDLLPPAPQVRPGRMVGFGSAMFGVQITALVLAPPAGWNGPVKPSAANLRRAFTEPPTWNDGGSWASNYLAQPLMGSLLYTAARRSNYGQVGSFLFATAANTLWEYGVQGWFEQPSWSDLLVTSTTGALLGEARWWARQRLLRGGRPGFWGQLGLAVADPIAEAQLIFQALAGRKAARDLF
ncbi:MAG TPA: DUF3943 domain-containing protein, partial [Anaeromyxobacteraceae bacterium]|nr:DUF3943 domain-containing protein [Anaeromyxobacteraceae bacterium]